VEINYALVSDFSCEQSMMQKTDSPQTGESERIRNWLAEESLFSVMYDDARNSFTLLVEYPVRSSRRVFLYRSRDMRGGLVIYREGVFCAEWQEKLKQMSQTERDGLVSELEYRFLRFNVYCEIFQTEADSLAVSIARRLLDDQVSKGHIIDVLSENDRCERLLVEVLRRKLGNYAKTNKPSIYL
jgi:hypothetical protein